MNSWIHDTFGMRFYKEESKEWFSEKIYPLLEECIQVFDDSEQNVPNVPANTKQINRAYKAFGDLVVAIKAMGHPEQIVEDAVFYEEASKYLNTMSVNGKFKIVGEDRFADKSRYYQTKGNTTATVFDAEKSNFIHTQQSESLEIPKERREEVEQAFELPLEKIEAGYLFKIIPDEGIPPRCHPLHSPHIYRYGTIGFAFLMSMPFNWSTEKDHYSVVFNYYRKGAYRRCERKISMLHGDLPYVRYLLDEWNWGEDPIEEVTASIHASSDETKDGLSGALAERLTSLLYYMNVIWLTESHGLQLKPSDDSFLNFESLDTDQKLQVLQSFEQNNAAFFERCYADFDAIKKMSGLDLEDISQENTLRHYGIIPSSVSIAKPVH